MRRDNKVRDPVCGMEVDLKTAIQIEIRGKTFYFCSEECANSFGSYLQNMHRGLKLHLRMKVIGEGKVR